MNALYILFAVALAVVSIFTGEVVSFITLGLILMALNNILQVSQDRPSYRPGQRVELPIA